MPVEKQQRLRRDIDSSLFLFTYFRCCSGHTDVDKRTFLSYNSFLLHIPTNIFNEIKFFFKFWWSDPLFLVSAETVSYSRLRLSVAGLLFFFLSIIVSYLSRSSQSIVSQCPDTKQVGVKQVVPYWNGESAVCRFGKLYFTEQLACVQSRFITHGCLNWNDSSLSTCALLVVSIDCHSKRGGDYIYLLVDFILFSFRSGAFSWACCIGRHLRVGFHYLLVIIDSFCLC